MGTYDDSKYVTARKARDCDKCGAHIPKGVRYLAYKPGLRSTIHVCLPCSVAQAPATGGTAPVYFCRAVYEAIAAGSQLHKG